MATEVSVHGVMKTNQNQKPSGIQMDHKIQWQCATTSVKMQTIKAAMTDQEKLLNILKSMSIILEDHTSVVHPDQIEEIISTLKTPGVAPAKSTRAPKKERVWALLPDLCIAKQKLEQSQKAISAMKTKQQLAKLANTTKQWVVEEGSEYLSQHTDDDPLSDITNSDELSP